MPKIQFSDLDPTEKRAVFWLADEADTLTSNITASASHVGEIFEAVSFLRGFPKGTAAHAMLAERLRLGSASAESVLACIERAAATYRTLADSADAELGELLLDLSAHPGIAAAS